MSSIFLRYAFVPAPCASMPLARQIMRFAFAPTSVRFYSEGATGSYTRSDGSHDSFNQREKAYEDLYIRERQVQQLKDLKLRLKSLKKESNEIQAQLNKFEDS